MRVSEGAGKRARWGPGSAVPTPGVPHPHCSVPGSPRSRGWLVRGSPVPGMRVKCPLGSVCFSLRALEGPAPGSPRGGVVTVCLGQPPTSRACPGGAWRSWLTQVHVFLPWSPSGPLLTKTPVTGVRPILTQHDHSLTDFISKDVFQTR